MAEVLEHRIVAEGLAFPEGPVPLPDGSVLFVEVRAGRLSRWSPPGGVTVVAELNPAGHGGANGAAIGPDGACYVANNGGFAWHDVGGGMLMPVDPTTGASDPPGYEGGWIDRVDLMTGESTVLYRECDGQPLIGPNDLVFDATGGFWFTDHGKTLARTQYRGGLYYAQPDGSSIIEAHYGLWGPNGVGLSPDGTEVVVAETFTGRLWSYALDGPGQLRRDGGRPVRRLLASTPGHFDSLAVEADGTVAVAAIQEGVCVVAADGSGYDYVPMPPSLTTNIAFGGPDRRTAYVTLSGTGQLAEMRWPRPGLDLSF